ncbi:MAG TPA: tetratricopeptide repeat protein [Candidatus Hydrogenedentes bacterium]|nr:tetratricopeptide repeat protein [Candidatus Hydrogenedentota bacterium]HOS02048.1 tetratricopeptide repeat protein [Candidatus Hydrogenedentota bacterium]
MARTIAAALIVRDESALLAECLQGVRGLVDELVVVDTGSSDDTVAIARSAGAKVPFFLWCDDFAAARNESLWHCTADWVFIIDADERIVPDDLPAVRALAQGSQDSCYRFVTRNYTNTRSVSEFHPCAPDDPIARGFAGWYPSAKVRLFPNRRGAAFEGNVHESVVASLERAGIVVVDCPIPIHHYPLERGSERVRQKQEQYIRLGLHKLQAAPDDARAAAELGNQYAEIGNYPQAAAAYRESLKRDPSNPVVLKDLAGVLHLLGRNDEAKRFIKVALELDPAYAEAWRALGVIMMAEKQWRTAVECFQQEQRHAPEAPEVHRHLSLALEGDNRLEEAALESRAALESAPDSVEALQLYVHQMLRLERRPQARAALLDLVSQGHDLPNLHNVIGELFFYDHLIEEAKTHFRRAGAMGLAAAHNNLGVVFFNQGQYEEAREAFLNCLAIDPEHRGSLRSLGIVAKYLDKH